MTTTDRTDRTAGQRYPWQTPGAVPSNIREGDRITITGNHGGELAVIVGTVHPSPRGGGAVFVSWSEINQRGKTLTSRFGASGAQDITGPEGGSWHWWATRRPAPATAAPARRRLLRADGDGQAVFRTANKFRAEVAVYVAPADADRAEQGNHPGLILTVDNDGSWTLAHELAGWGQVPPTVLATGHADQVPAVVPADGGARTVFAWVIDGEIHRGDAGGLAGWAAAARMGYEDTPPAVVYAATDTGALVPVPVRVECGPFGPDGMADLTATVDLGNDRRAVGHARVDGRA